MGVRLCVTRVSKRSAHHHAKKLSLLQIVDNRFMARFWRLAPSAYM